MLHVASGLQNGVRLACIHQIQLGGQLARIVGHLGRQRMQYRIEYQPTDAMALAQVSPGAGKRRFFPVHRWTNKQHMSAAGEGIGKGFWVEQIA